MKDKKEAIPMAHSSARPKSFPALGKEELVRTELGGFVSELVYINRYES